MHFLYYILFLCLKQPLAIFFCIVLGMAEDCYNSCLSAGWYFLRQQLDNGIGLAVFTFVGLVPLIFFQGSKKNLLESVPPQSEQEKEVNMKKTEENENLEDKVGETTGADESLSIKVEAEEEKAKSG